LFPTFNDVTEAFFEMLQFQRIPSFGNPHLAPFEVWSQHMTRLIRLAQRFPFAWCKGAIGGKGISPMVLMANLVVV
jgi:hypothetical protein